ncbi:uncharacterized protein FIBRA_02495 [Fibroporia radiculosa]|uniref:SHSP domain-containing protein n=1 Tax=Fibroporia radiculosa TaxID=599839 RepID=J4HV14_9APHY|nr:uncharacterized protein FIBRA_02495 [Fibroporia radiculosa]CCM00462.1 predicted protein [Fibroporia radiculosa]
MSFSTFFYEPFYSLADFDRLFDDAFSARSASTDDRQVQRMENTAPSARSFRPKMDLHEDSEANTMRAMFELPGLSKENVQIGVQNGVLSVAGECKEEGERDEGGYKVRERRFGKFQRAIPLPQGVKSEDIKANMQDGILTVTYPKSTPETTPKKITIS